MEKYDLSKLFAPYEIAVRMRDKGFDYDCLGYYQLGNNQLVMNNLPNSELDRDKLGIGAPTWDQVQEWLLNKLEVFVNLGFSRYKAEDHYNYRCNTVLKALELY